MRVVFMGTPSAAVPSLRALASAFDVVAVYTRPDRPQGRGLKVTESPVKTAATELGIDVVQPARLKGEADRVQAFAPDVVVVVAYGAILPSDMLRVPRLGCVNVHFSLLPRWRGAAPVERAILAGDETTGVTTMVMDEGLDTGPILYRESTEIGSDDTTGTLRDRLAGMGAGLIVRTLRDLDAGAVAAQPQPDDGVTIAAKIEAAEAELDPARPAVELGRTVRALDPAPGAFLWFRGKRLKVWKAAVVPGQGEPGTLDSLDVQTANDSLRLVDVQPEGRKRMSAEAFANGYRLEPGEKVGPAARIGSPDG
ncbi:MAG: methionyl-tRNA formyltransferase [Actinomycetota bacterium]